MNIDYKKLDGLDTIILNKTGEAKLRALVLVEIETSHYRMSRDKEEMLELYRTKPLEDFYRVSNGYEFFTNSDDTEILASHVGTSDNGLFDNRYGSSAQKIIIPLDDIEAKK